MSSCAARSLTMRASSPPAAPRCRGALARCRSRSPAADRGAKASPRNAPIGSCSRDAPSTPSRHWSAGCAPPAWPRADGHPPSPGTRTPPGRPRSSSIIAGVPAAFAFQATAGARPRAARPAVRSRLTSAGTVSMARPASRIQSARSAAKLSPRGPRLAIAIGSGPGLHGSAAPRAANSPAWSTTWPRKSSSTTSMHSIRALSGRRGARPSGPSTRVPPAPKPAATRPGASSASAANAAAEATGWRLWGLVTAPKRSTWRVRRASAVRVTYRSRSVPSSATRIAAAPSNSAAAASSANSATGRTACSPTPQCVSGKDTGAHFTGQQLERPGFVRLRADDVPGENAPQAGARVLLKPGRDVIGVAGGGKRIDQAVGDEFSPGLETILDNRQAHALDLALIRTGCREDHRLDTMNVIRQHAPHGVTGGPAIGVDADQDVAHQVDLGRVATRRAGASGDLVAGPPHVTGTGDGAQLHAVGPGARRTQHPAVDRADVDRNRRTEPRKVEVCLRPHREDLAVDTTLSAQHAAHDANALNHRGQRTFGPIVGFAQRPQGPQRRPDAKQHAATAGLVERRGFHGDHRRMAPEGIDNPHADFDPRGRRGDLGGHRKHSPAVTALGQPHLVEAELFSLPGQRHRRADRHLVGQREPQPPRCGRGTHPRGPRTSRAQATRPATSSIENAGRASEVAPSSAANSPTWTGSGSWMIRSSSAAVGTNS